MQPLTLVTTRSPDKITPSIAAGCARLVPGGTPIFVDREPFAESRINKCTFNVRKFLADNPGEMVLGWEVCVWEGVLLDCIGHAVVRHEERLRCVTPSKYGDSKLLFLPDPRISFDFEDSMARMPAKQVPLSTRPEVPGETKCGFMDRRRCHCHPPALRVSSRSVPPTFFGASTQSDSSGTGELDESGVAQM